jgi:hypothetical protein
MGPAGGPLTRPHLGLALLVGGAVGFAAAAIPAGDPDLFWHLTTGQQTIAHGFVRSDLFSWTARGQPVSTDQWLGQVLIYVAYLAGEWRGVIALRVIAAMALVGLVVVNALVVRPDRPLVAVLAALPAIFLTRYVTVDRPEVLGFAFFSALLVLLRLGRAGAAWALVASVALVALWANVHGSFALGLVLTLLVAIEGAWRDGAHRVRYALVAVAVAAAPLLTPAGLGVWSAPGTHLLSPPREIEEWGLVDVTRGLGALYAVTLALVLARALLGPRVDARELVILVPVALLSLTALRQTPLLAIAAAPYLATVPIAGRRRHVITPDVVGLLLAGAGLLSAAAGVAIAPPAPDESSYPREALAALPSGPGLFDRYEWGGWLIWRAPGTPVFIDGRLTPYVGATIADYRTIIAAAPGWRDVVDRRGITALLVRPSDPIAVRAAELGWRSVASSDRFVLLTRPR